MILQSLLLPVLLQAAPPAGALPQSEHHDLVRILVKEVKDWKVLASLDLDVATSRSHEEHLRELEVVTSSEDLARIRKSGLDFKILIKDLETTIGNRLSKYVFPEALTPPLGQGGMGGHYTFAQMVAILDQFAKSHPKICSVKASIGKTVQGRDIWMVKISDNVNMDENEPEVLYDAMHHAREPVSMETTLLFMDWLLDGYGKDPEATYLVDNREMFFVPCLNPDGYEYNRLTTPKGGGMWRKNRRLNYNNSYGVDLNRNWATGWGTYGGGSSNPNSQVYWGPKAFSEPETLALETFIKGRKFAIGCTAHTYSDILLRPWGYKRGETANVADYRKIDQQAVATTGIRAGAASLILYLAAGTALDHYHQAHGMFSYTPELGTSSEGGFWPGPTALVNIAKRHQHMFRTFARVAGAYMVVGSVQIIEAPGGNNNGKVEPGETGRVIVVLTNNGIIPPVTRVLGALVARTPGLTVTKGSHDFGMPGKFSSVSNSGSPFEFQVPKSFTSPLARLELKVTYEGWTKSTPIELLFVDPVTILTDDFEKDRGFSNSIKDTATTGRFTRMAPQQTSYGGRIYQPGSDHTPSPGTLCWVTDGRAGTSVGRFDVDGGKTHLLSPVLDLSHVASPRIAIWYWYSESVNPGDPFIVEASNDGGSTFKVVFKTTTPTFSWRKLEIPLTGITPTSKMQIRFTAQDLSPSLVEALVDDIEIRGVVSPASLTFLGSGKRGSILRMGLEGKAGGLSVILFSTGIADFKVPGIGGRLLLDPAKLFLLPPLSYGTSDRIEQDLPIPNDSSLIGKTFYAQQLLIASPTSLDLGNRTQFTAK